jgi:hypothetical protein
MADAGHIVSDVRALNQVLSLASPPVRAVPESGGKGLVLEGGGPSRRVWKSSDTGLCHFFMSREDGCVLLFAQCVDQVEGKSGRVEEVSVGRFCPVAEGAKSRLSPEESAKKAGRLLQAILDAEFSSRLEPKVDLPAEPAPDSACNPGKETNFNNGQWNDLTSIFNSGSSVYFYTDNKYGGTAEISIIAAFDHPPAVKIQAHSHSGGAPAAENQGKEARLHVDGPATDRDLAQLKKGLEKETISAQTVETLLEGKQVYVLTISAPDHGYHAAYTLEMDMPARAAIGKAQLDDKTAWRARIAPCR